MSICTMRASPRTGSATRRGTTSYAILGLLSVRSWTTYELAKQVRRSLNWFWPRAERKLYDEPKALAAAGLATAEKQYTGQRSGTLYSITPEGREALRDWLDEPPAPQVSEFEAMLKVFFADAGSLAQLSGTLSAVEASAAERLRSLAAMMEQALDGASAFPERQHIGALSLRLGAAQELAALRWARWAREQIGTWRSTTDPGRWDHRQAHAELVGEIRTALAG
jgi:PadR family transcriptional regulator, regulatory protein AphA